MLIISDFNAQTLAALFNNDSQAPHVKAGAAGFSQVIPALLDEHGTWWQDKTSALVWTQPQAISETYSHASRMQPVEHERALVEVDAFCRALITGSKHVQTMLVATWHVPSESRGYGMLDLQQGLGLRSLLMRMNQRLVEQLSGHQNIYVLDASRWFACKDAIATKMWYLAKVPFSNEVFKEAIGDVKAALRGVQGDARKVIICDLDDTLWGGVVGDIGWENLRLGGHDAIGEALLDFQQELKALTRRGIILAIVSKNTERVALHAIQSHPEMVLRKDDFAGWRINWNDKAQNIADLMKELNLGLQSAVFLDDNPVERARVADALPEVLVPALPKDPMLYASTLRRLACFDTPSLSVEDRERANMYKVERTRRAAHCQAEKVDSLDDWLQTLEIKVQVEPINSMNRQRTWQLLNKTNQMNLATRRMSEAELVEWASGPNRKLLTFRVADKFGDSGLTGIASVEVQGDDAFVTDYVLSCRTMGKRVEETIAQQLTECARVLGAKKLFVNYRPTPKNKPCLDFWKRSGFSEESDYTFVWDLSQVYPSPEAVELIVNEGAQV